MQECRIDEVDDGRRRNGFQHEENLCRTVRVGGYEPLWAAGGVQVVGTLAYVANWERGLWIFSLDFGGPVVETIGPLPDATLDARYSQRLAAAGGTLPCVWSGSAGALPAGLTLSRAGVVVGTPTATGTFRFTPRIADNDGRSCTRELSLTITPPSSAAVALRIGKESAEDTVTLAWPAVAAGFGFTLESTARLPTPAWFPVVEPAELVGDEIRVTVRPALTNRIGFFRLQKP